MRFFKSLRESFGWQDMQSAPRDGSEIEIRCTYGFEPWVQRARWARDDFHGAIWRFGEYDVGAFKCKTFVEDRNFGPRSAGANNSCLQWRLP